MTDSTTPREELTVRPLVAMVSYQWEDAEAAELLHTELALRGLSVIHDRCSFPQGSRIPANMAEAVATCDGFVAYLTPSSLYESATPGSPRPAIDAEFKPAMARRRASLATESSHQEARPVIVPLTHRLGDPRADAPARVRRATGEDISSLWTPLTLDQSTPRITQPEAAAVSHALLGVLLPPGTGPVDDPIDLLVSTRGTGQPPAFLSIDATNIVGGKDARPGSTQDWQRFLHALRDVEAALARWAQSRLLRLRVRAHLTAAIGVGRVFNQAAGWQLDVEGRHGLSSSRHVATTPPPNVSWDPMGGTRDLLVEIDLLGHPVSDLATFVAASLDDTPVGRLQVRRAHSSTGDLLPYEIAAGVTVATREIRTIVGTTRPASIHMFCASPVEFAVLLGHRLTSLHADVHLYERHGDEYHPSLTLDRTIP